MFDARSENGSAFNARFFDNRMLWLSLIGTLTVQAIAVHWPPASAVFGTTGMTWSDWAIAIGVAATILAFDEVRKLVIRMLRASRDSFRPT